MTDDERKAYERGRRAERRMLEPAQKALREISRFGDRVNFEYVLARDALTEIKRREAKRRKLVKSKETT